MNWSLEIARAITGGIGIVLTIPITIALMQLWHFGKEVTAHERSRRFSADFICINVDFGGKSGAIAFGTLFLNFILLVIAIIMMIFGIPIYIVTLIFCIIVAAINLFALNSFNIKTFAAFIASIVTTVIMLAAIYLSIHFGHLQGFTQEEQDETYIFQ